MLQQEGHQQQPACPHDGHDGEDGLVHVASSARGDGRWRSTADGGEGSVVEIDETFIGKKGEKPKNARGYAHKHAVLTLVERAKGSRSFHVDGTKATDLVPIIKAHVDPKTHVMTDEAGQYAHLSKHFADHDFVRHGTGEYGRGLVHTNTVEGFYSVFKRGMKGVY